MNIDDISKRYSFGYEKPRIEDYKGCNPHHHTFAINTDPTHTLTLSNVELKAMHRSLSSTLKWSNISDKEFKVLLELHTKLGILNGLY